MYLHLRLNGILPEINDTACVCRQAPNLKTSRSDTLKRYPGKGQFLFLVWFPFMAVCDDSS